MSSRAKRNLLWMLGTVLLFALSASYLLAQRRSTPIYGDEPGWIGAGYQTADLLLEGEFDTAGLTAIRRNYGNLNPQLGKLMLGVPLALYSDRFLDGARFELMTTYQWNKESYAFKRARGELPPRSIFFSARAITAIYGALCVVAVFAAGMIWFDARVAVLAALLLIITPAFVQSTTRAMTDVYYNLFLLAGCVAVSQSVRVPAGRKALVLAAACGVLGGLASAVKVTGFLLVGAAYAVAVAARAIRESTGFRPVVGQLAAFTVVALVCIYALNPFYWPELEKVEPAELAREFRQVVSGDEGVAFSAPLPVLLGAIEYDRREIVAAYPQLYNVARPLEFPIHFLRWERLWDKQERLGPWGGPRFSTTVRKLGVGLAVFPFEWVFALWGGVYCARSTRREWRDGRVSPLAVVLVWPFLIAAGVAVAAPRPEARFFLPALIATRILVAVGICSAFDDARKRLLALRTQPEGVRS